MEYSVILINHSLYLIKLIHAFLNKISVKNEIQKYIAIDISWYTIPIIVVVVLANWTTKYLV